MMAVGEFTWATTDSGDMMVQVRQQPANGSRTISINTAIAIPIDGDKIEITPPPAPGAGRAVRGRAPTSRRSAPSRSPAVRP